MKIEEKDGITKLLMSLLLLLPLKLTLENYRERGFDLSLKLIY